MCGNNRSRGILLNDKSFLCDSCYAEVSKISYPEKYERIRRQFLIASEARRLAWEGFRGKYEVQPEQSIFVALGWLSTLLAFANVALLVVPFILLVIGYTKNATNKRRVQEWLSKKDAWEHRNPSPATPVLKHFHDPTAELTRKDQNILYIFNHWPGYPPFWSYLRQIVLKRDGARCQVTGCPSRLELHIHHIQPVSQGGQHAPSNLIALCDFHHALEPEKGHERVWGAIKTRYFTLVSGHERSNRNSSGHHHVRAHLRRLQLVSLEEIKVLTKT
ncbi:HNH endonuclease [Dyella sp. KRB-257]|uniref:HNH endonuclease n=1 Tax=Dyella sp. KRB-257 TaxID=3400915 RepID=UPI003C0E56EF